MLKKSISLFLVFVMVVIPIIVNAQAKASDEIAQAISQAKADAKSDVNKIVWIGTGCIFTFFGVGAAYLLSPSPKATRLLGKSPEYVKAYIKYYKKKARFIRLVYATGGCVVITTLFIISALTGGTEGVYDPMLKGLGCLP